MKDLFANEIKVGDRVIYVYKSYGRMALNSASLSYGFVENVTAKTVTIKSPIKVGDRVYMYKNDPYPTKLVANFETKSDCVMVVDKFPTALVKSLKTYNRQPK